MPLPAPAPAPAPLSAPAQLGPRPSTAGSRSLQAASAPQWTIEQVGRWLGVLGLERYVAQFAAHEVSGAVLLDVSSSDLDFVGVPVLAHRKLLLSGVQQLRDAVAVAGGGGGAGAAPPPAKASVHWSHLQPLNAKVAAATDTALDASGAPQADSSAVKGSGVRGGSLLDGSYDEEAEASAFKAAVEAWRRSGVPRPACKEEAKGGADDDGSLWQNPFGGASQDSAPGVQSLLAANPPRRVPTPPRNARPPPPAVSSSGVPRDEGGAGGSLAEGSLDEEAEAAAFREAVLAWRRDGAKPGDAGGAAIQQQPLPSTVSAEAGGSALPLQGPRLTCYSCLKQFTAAQAFTPSVADVGEAAEVDSQLLSRAFCSEACFGSLRASAVEVLARRQSDHAALADELARTERERDDAERSLAALRAALVAEEAAETAEGSERVAGDTAAGVHRTDEGTVNYASEELISGSCGSGEDGPDIDSVTAGAALAASLMHAEKSLARAAGTSAITFQGHTIGPVAPVGAHCTAALQPQIDIHSVDFNSLV